MNKIDDFHGEFFFLSNFFEYPFWYLGREWKTVEHAFQALKCANKEDIDKVHAAPTPGEAKRIGRRATLIPNWDYKRNNVMMRCLLMKFLQNDELLGRLMATGDAVLIEGNTWHDNYWGDCHCEKCKDKPGSNMLGNMLMEIRHNVRNGNYIWCVRDMQNGGEITQYFKTRERALRSIAAEARKCNMTLVNPYECNDWHLDVVCLTE